MIRPWISTNLAVSADGKISSSGLQPSGWTSKADHARLLRLRAAADALIVGRGTLDVDRMTLTVPGSSRPPLRCIVSRSGSISPDHPVFQKAGGPVHLLITEPSLVETAHPLGDLAKIHYDTLAGFLHTLATGHGVNHLHCEGGGGLIHALAGIDAIDEFHLTLAGHTLFGGATAPTATGVPADFLPKSLDFELTQFDPPAETGECFLSYRRITAGPPAQ